MSLAKRTPGSDCPAFQRDHMAILCVVESPARFSWVIGTTFEKKIYAIWCCIDLLSPQRLSANARR